MASREDWRRVLDAEVQSWSALSWDRIVLALRDMQVYEVPSESGTCQVEVQLVENTREYVHVLVSVDDGRLPGSMFPLSESFICYRGFQEKAALSG